MLREDGSWFAAVSLRSLAGELDLAKDTIAGAMQLLAAHNLVERRRQDHVAGRFVAGGYVVHRPTRMVFTATGASTDRPEPAWTRGTGLDSGLEILRRSGTVVTVLAACNMSTKSSSSTKRTERPIFAGNSAVGDEFVERGAADTGQP
ncbi:MAG: hypothetical protein R2715_07590 [Ilumatobacteraceae bacterium]